MIDKEILKAKADAVKEFAERLKSKSQLVAPSAFAEMYRAVAVDDIDLLVARMYPDFGEVFQGANEDMRKEDEGK